MLQSWAAIKARAEASLSRGHRVARLRRRFAERFDPDEPRDEHGRWTDGGGDDDDSADVAAVHEPSGAQVHTFHELNPAAAEKFRDAIKAAKEASPYGAAVELHDAADYARMRTFVTPDRKAGFALDGDNIVSLFKHPGATQKGVARSALELATKEGGKRLDAFDTALPHLYADAGFRAVARLPFDDKYAPAGWNAETYKKFNGGKPDVVFMVHDPALVPTYKRGDGKKVADYDAGVGAQAAALKAIPARDAKVAAMVAAVPGAAEKSAEARAKLATAVRTDALVSSGGYKTADGEWTPARQALHDKIIAGMFAPDRVAAAKPKEGERPTVHLLGGSGGSGKGWFVRSGKVPADKAIYINSDDVKAQLPEFKGWNASLLHEESSDVAAEAEARARDLGLNVILDGTMSSESALERRLALYAGAGYKIAGHYMRVTPETSVKRALERFVRGGKDGRFVVPQYILGGQNLKNFESTRDRMDSWEMYDNEGDKPKLVASG